MGKKKILIAEMCTEFGAVLSQALETRYDVQLCHNGPTARKILEAQEFDVLILDMSLPGADGLALLEWINQFPYQPLIVALTYFISKQLEMTLANLNVEMVAVKPCRVEYLIEQLEDLMPAELPAHRLQPHASIGGMLSELELPPHRWGYTYLEDAIDLYITYPTQTLTKFIYPEIAGKYDSTPKAVERAIRKVIRDTYERRYNRMWEVYFNFGRDEMAPIPTNAQFIAAIAAKFKQTHI